MLKALLSKLVGSYSDREIKRISKTVQKVLALEEVFAAKTDAELKEMTVLLKGRLAQGETLDDILPEAFATVREAAYRVIGMKHYPVQIMGGIILHQGRIAEMKTGEGKTLVATLPAYLNALSGKGVHIVTVNDYLAKRDSEWMGKVYKFLGLTVGLVIHDVDPSLRKSSYAADITYGTNNEFGFDYLRDNMVIYKENMVQRGHSFAIVDEVDSILIDEARTPLIISGPGEESTDLYDKANAFARRLKGKTVVEVDMKEEEEETEADYIVDEKAHTATLTKVGVEKAEAAFGIENLSDPENMKISHHINQAIRAYGIMKRDVNYVVRDGEVIIVDEFTGRLMFGRRYSEGLHQAIEAKEGVKVERENKTLATITFQNYFRLYNKLSGMTGTAITEETEFQEIYKLDVVEIPTNKEVRRQDKPDFVYKTEEAKFRNAVDEIERRHKNGQPVLVGTVTIEKSEFLSGMLKRRGIKHEVLNAKNHTREAAIVAQAGKFGAVTIATNMAGRGTDIILGGNAEFLAKAEMAKQGIREEIIAESVGFADTDNEEIISARALFNELMIKFKAQVEEERAKVVSAGGLMIIGTERHESRRIDNQLRGRAGRQGDPGETRFYISFEDDLMRKFIPPRILEMAMKAQDNDDEPIEMQMFTNAIERAQKAVEGRNFQTRKHVLEYDDVMNKQREVIYGQRQKVLDGEDIRDTVLRMIESAVEEMVDINCAGGEFPDDWNLRGIEKEGTEIYSIPGKEISFANEDMNYLTKEKIKDMVREAAMEKYAEKETLFGEGMREVERVVLLRTVDQKWIDHIDDMDQLRHGITLRAYGQKNPVTEYQVEGFNMFEEMIASISRDTAKTILNVYPAQKIERKQVAVPLRESRSDDSGVKQPVKKATKVGRNDPCPCGSGKKYKKCCGFDGQD